MLQTAKKILTSTNFHLQDVLKLKKRIILHFRLFCSTFGHLKKKSPKFAQKQRKSHIFEISNFDLRPELAGNRPICCPKVGSVPKSCQNFFYVERTKIDDFISKKHTPPKKGPFFGGGVRRQVDDKNNVSWADNGFTRLIIATHWLFPATGQILKFQKFAKFRHF